MRKLEHRPGAAPPRAVVPHVLRALLPRFLTSSLPPFPALPGLALFGLLTVLVHYRVLAGFDLAVTEALTGIDSRVLDALSAVVAVLLSAEVCLGVALVTAWHLFRRGAGLSALAPLAFVLPTLLEVLLKAVIAQPNVGDRFVHQVPYPLLGAVLQGAYPSGHAMRTAFAGVFLARLLPLAPRSRRRPLGAALTAVVLLFALSRIYMGYHWTSDVIGGLVLGASVGLVVAPPAALYRRAAGTSGGRGGGRKDGGYGV